MKVPGKVSLNVVANDIELGSGCKTRKVMLMKIVAGKSGFKLLTNRKTNFTQVSDSFVESNGNRESSD